MQTNPFCLAKLYLQCQVTLSLALSFPSPQELETVPALSILDTNQRLSHSTPDNNTHLLSTTLKVPSTSITLQIRFYHPLDPPDMRDLILFAGIDIQYDIDTDPRVSPSIPYPVYNKGTDRRQQFHHATADDIELVVFNGDKDNGGRRFTWGQLRDVIRGLDLFMVIGKRPFETTFKFWDGDGKSDVGLLGRGVVRRAIKTAVA